MTADRNISGTATTQNRICRDRMLSGREACGNGSRPCIVNQVEISASDKRDTLKPPKPNRAAAHNNNGRGAYSNAGAVAGDTACKPNTKTARSTVATASRAASPHRVALILRIEERSFGLQTTVGTIVSSANALVQNRCIPSCQ